MKRMFWLTHRVSFDAIAGRYPRVARRAAPFALAALSIVLFSGGCQAPSTSPSSPAPVTPLQATSPAPTPIPVATSQPAVSATTPAADNPRPVIIEFAKSFNALNKDWESNRRAYEDWRQTGSCSESAMRDSLSNFATSFQKIKKMIAGLPDSQASRGVVTQLVQAAEKEESALSDLRVNWKPGDESAFQKYEAARFAVDGLRRQAVQGLDDLNAASQPANVDAIDKYQQALAPINNDWNALDRSYDDWRRSAPGDQTSPDTSKAAPDPLQKLVSNAQDILNRVYALPRPVLLRGPSDLLVAAAERQVAAYKKLNATWKPGDSDSLSAFDSERLQVNKMRRDSALAVQGVAAAGFGDSKTAVSQLASLEDQVDKAWNDFRAQYDAWRGKGGDCDRASVRQQLGDRVTGFHVLAVRAYGLPQSSSVRPLADLMAQAAEKEETALRQLRDAWKPYDSSFYQTYEKEWVAIDRLRRQASAGLTDLMQKNNISPTDIGQ